MVKMVLSLLFATCLHWVFPIHVEAIRDIPDDNLAYPVLIQGHTISGSMFLGSGFYLTKDNFLFLITARHIFFSESKDEKTKQPTLKLLEVDQPVSCLSYSKDPEESGVNIFSVDLKALDASEDLKKHLHRIS
jgi:hypothetical protein